MNVLGLVGKHCSSLSVKINCKWFAFVCRVTISRLHKQLLIETNIVYYPADMSHTLAQWFTTTGFDETWYQVNEWTFVMEFYGGICKPVTMHCSHYSFFVQKMQTSHHALCSPCTNNMPFTLNTGHPHSMPCSHRMFNVHIEFTVDGISVCKKFSKNSAIFRQMNRLMIVAVKTTTNINSK